MFQTLFVSLFLLLLPVLLLFIKRTKSINNLNLPPSPPKLPFIGNLHQLGSLPHLSLRALANKYGPIMLLQLGQVPTVVISSPEMARQVMKNHDMIFASRPPSRIAKIICGGSDDIAFAPYGEYWRQSRKLCITHLLSTKMVQSFRHAKEEEVEVMMNKISQLSSTASAVNVSEVLDFFSSDVISRAVSNNFSREDMKETLRELSKGNSDLLGAFHIADFFPMFGWLDPFGLYVRAKTRAQKWENVLDEIIKEHEKNQSVQDDDHSHKNSNFVDVLLSLGEGYSIDFPFTRDNIKAILVDMFAAGIDTSYTVLEYSMAELVQNPKVMEKLQAEIRGAAKGNSIVREEDLSEMSYLKVVIKEVMRLHPPVPLLLPRESTETCKLSGYHIPKKTRVIVNVWAIGRDPMIWEDPDEFRPERFIGSSIDFKGSDFEFIPFGAGRRICPGINFAMQTVELALANLINRFDWALPSKILKNGLNMNDKFGLVTSMAQRLDLVATQVQFG